jgi:thymidine phosphorylase
MTDMNNPIGKMIGNALEIAESLHCLHGNGPSDLEDLVLRLGKFRDRNPHYTFLTP